MFIELLERIFTRSGDSRQEVKNRLKLVLAHDRSDIPPHLLDAMRKEILEVVSRYVELDTEAMEFALENSDRATALIANLPIRRLCAPSEDAEVRDMLDIPPITENSALLSLPFITPEFIAFVTSDTLEEASANLASEANQSKTPPPAADPTGEPSTNGVATTETPESSPESGADQADAGPSASPTPDFTISEFPVSDFPAADFPAADATSSDSSSSNASSD
jgi:cell division topological specificity factor